ncbi:ABC transporter permease [Adhaeribacter sp. BT258]|uniref:ABC transporter permease n=1 Tax=Adhaeribacter terrigena TaxID=2793070 RepID=A0ABS1C1R0_9BACT|nr:ABC transporter permease [Adhaeribacter terrigena]MBK0403333.1 ABC transporter permease [Adhaeribacter terrigena]
MIWQRLKRARQQQWTFKLAAVYLLVLLVCMLFAPFLSAGFHPNFLDLSQTYQAPFFFQAHWLGTDQLGRDVWANLLYGCRTAFLVAVPVMLLALVAGTGLGMAAAWFGNKLLHFRRAAAVSLGLWLFAVWFYGFYRADFSSELDQNAAGLLRVGWLAVLSAVAIVLNRLLKTLPFLAKKVPLPLDELLLKTMEVLASVPRLILVLSFAALLSPGIGNVVLLLLLTYWIGPARLARAETLKMKQLPYIEAAQASGLPVWRILSRHVLPNAAAPLVTAFCFGLSGLLGLEATLSFLGIGLPPETPSLGRMLAGARLNTDAWWLVLFPALLLCLTILAIQTIGQAFRKALEVEK